MNNCHELPNNNHSFALGTTTNGSAVIFCTHCGEIRPLELPKLDVTKVPA